MPEITIRGNYLFFFLPLTITRILRVPKKTGRRNGKTKKPLVDRCHSGNLDSRKKKRKEEQKSRFLFFFLLWSAFSRILFVQTTGNFPNDRRQRGSFFFFNMLPVFSCFHCSFCSCFCCFFFLSISKRKTVGFTVLSLWRLSEMLLGRKRKEKESKALNS